MVVSTIRQAPRPRSIMRTEASEELDRIDDVGQDQHDAGDQDHPADNVCEGQQPRRVDRTGIGSSEEVSEGPSHRLVEGRSHVPAVQWQQRHEVEEGHEQIDRAKHSEQTCDLCSASIWSVKRSPLPLDFPTIDIGP